MKYLYYSLKNTNQEKLIYINETLIINLKKQIWNIIGKTNKNGKLKENKNMNNNRN